MQPVQKGITGNEAFGACTTPRQALAQFYRTFNRGDLE